MATLVKSQVLNHSARSCSSWVNVPKARIGVSLLSRFTAAICIVDPMSIAAAPGSYVSSSGDWRFWLGHGFFSHCDGGAEPRKFAIFLTGSPPEWRHHSQVRNSQYATFFNGVESLQ